MATLTLQRKPNGKIIQRQRRNILLAAASHRLNGHYRKLILAWIKAQPVITIGTPIATAITAANGIKTFL